MPPDVVRYRDFREWLRDRADFLRAHHKLPGHSSLAAAIGISTSQLSNVIAGRRDLEPALAADLAVALGLEGERHRYFVLLVLLEEAGSPGARAPLTQELDALQTRLTQPARRGRIPAEVRAARVKHIEAMQQGAYARIWVTSALYALLCCPAAPLTAAALAACLRRRTSATAIRASLQDLSEMGLVVERAGRPWPTADVAERRHSPEPIPRAIFASAWDLAQESALAREAHTTISATALWLAEGQRPEIQRAHIDHFFALAMEAEPDSARSCVTLERPELEEGEEPADRVVQRVAMCVPVDG